MKAAVLFAGVTAAIGFLVPAGDVAAQPMYPAPLIQKSGTYRVGVDIRPGLYLSRGAVDGGTCSWSRLASADSGDGANIIAHGESTAAQYAWIAPTDAAFETHGCQTWTMGTRSATPIAPAPKTCIYPLTGCMNPDEGRPRP